MTDSEIFEKLYNGGAFTKPLLLKLNHSTAGTIRITNNNVKIEYNNEKYSPCTFDYFPPNSDGSGAALNISSPAGENDVFDFIELADENYTLTLVACILDNEIQAIRGYKHFHGKVTVNYKGSIEFSLDGDDRQNMTFTPYKYDTENNKGNA